MRWRRFGISAVFALPVLLTAPLLQGDAWAQPSSRSARPWLGLSMEAAALAGRGVRVDHVVRGSPADRAGVREGDRVVRIGATRVAQSADVIRAVADHGVGEAVDIGYVRGGADQSARAVLVPFPSSDEMMRMDLVGTFAPTWKDVLPVSGTFPSSIAALRGHVVLIDFWATWCGPCRIAMPKLGALQGRYGAQGLRVLGVSTEDAEDVALFARRTEMAYAVGVDMHAETTRSYGVSSLPTLVVIDKRGLVRDVRVGYDPFEDARLEVTLRTLLAEAAPSD